MSFKIKRLLSILMVLIMVSVSAPLAYAEDENNIAANEIVDIKDGGEGESFEEEDETEKEEKEEDTVAGPEVREGKESEEELFFEDETDIMLFTSARTVVISNEEELIAFAEAVNGGQTELDAVLTDNITVTTEWTPIGLKDKIYSGTFDGDGYSITLSAGIAAYPSSTYGQRYGLFNTVSGTVQNLTVKGTITVNAGNVGGIAGYIDGGSILNCTNEADISGKNNVGGIVGMGKGEISKCVNTGGITATTGAGGIIGYASDGTAIDNCANTGDIESTGTNAGGISGSYSSTETIRYCYNTGNIKAKTNFAGGITGNTGYGKSLKIENSYSTGTVSGVKNIGALIGGENGTGNEYTNVYCLGDTPIGSIKGNNGGAKTVTEEELKNLTVELDGFNTSEDGYPVLSWQGGGGKQPSVLKGTLTVNGQLYVGSVLTAEYTGGDEDITYEWYRDSDKIDGITGNTYTVTIDDMDCVIKAAAVAEGFKPKTDTAGKVPMAVAIDVTPDTATVTVKDSGGNIWNEMTEEGFEGFYALPEGKYTYTAAAGGEYKDAEGEFTVPYTKNGGILEIKLDVKEYDVTFETTPEEVSVTVKQNGTVIEPKTGKTYSLPKGDFTYCASAFGYGDKEDMPFTVEGEGNISVSLDKLSEYEVVFKITKEEGGEESAEAITIRNEKYGKTLSAVDGKINLPDGDYTYTVSSKGYKTVKDSFNVNGSGSEIPVSLKIQTAWDGETLTEPTKDENGYYVITSPDELMWFNKNWGVNDKARLAADITINDGIADESAAYKWSPVGISAKKFNGVFDGGGHTIKGLYIKNTNSRTYGAAFIGYGTKDAVIKNLTIEGKIVSNSNYTGAFGGDYKGSIENCHNMAEINGADYTGGIVGDLGDGATMTNCSNLGSVSGTRYVGGLAGIIRKSNAFIKSFNRGDVTGIQKVGGVTGSIYSGGTVTDVYSNANVSATATSNGYAGGIAGEFRCGTIKNAYAAGSITSAMANGAGGAAGQLGTVASLSRTATNVKYIDTVENAAGGSASLNGTEAVSADTLKGLILSESFALDTGNINGGYPVLLWENGSGGDDKPEDEWETVKPQIKQGVYQITTAAELKWFANDIINNGNTDINAVLLKDIDTESRLWEPITDFTGVFDGGGFEIKNIKIETIKAGAGLFKTNGGTIKNLGVSGVINGGDYCAAIAAYNNGVIESCMNYAEINGGNHTAGITVQNGVRKGAEGKVSLCINGGKVSGGNYVGGITADNINGVIEKCANNGFVKGNIMVGGVLAANESSLTSSYNIGLVVGTGKAFRANIGGVLGWQNGTAENLYNTGAVVSAGGNIGGCVGLPTSDTLSKNLYGVGWVMGMYYDDGDNLELYYVGGAAGKKSQWVENAYYLTGLNGNGAGEEKDEEYLKGAEFATALGENFEADGGLNGGYPILSWQTAENTSQKTALTGTVTVSGVLEPENTLTATYNGNGENPVYVWYVTDGYDEFVYAIDTDTYKTTVADTGKVIYVKVFDGDYSGFAGGNTDGKITGMEGSVKIVGSAVVGKTLKAEYIGSEESPVYTWYRGNREIGTGESHTLSAEDAGYKIKVRVTGSKAGYIEGTLTDTVKTAEEAGVWPDSKCSEPANVGGVYYIETEKELYWFVSEVNSGNTELKAKLIKDINLTEDRFIPIGKTVDYEGIFDGNDKTVSGIKIESNTDRQGFFGSIGGKGTVKGLKVTVNIVSEGETAESIGGIAGYNEGKITDCTVSGNVKGNSNVGGIAGITGLHGKVYNCENRAAVSGKYGIGGVVGGCSYGEIYYSANTGSIKGESCTGGIVGRAENYAEITGCYSNGSVEGESYTGGIAGKIYVAAAPQGCYAAGEVKGGLYTGAVVGNIDGTEYILTVTGSFYNNALPKDTTAAARTESAMKAASFVNELNRQTAKNCFTKDSKNINGGYPVLLWQNGGKIDGGGSSDDDDDKKTVSVSFTLKGDIPHAVGEHSDYTTWIDTVTLKNLPKGTTAYDVFKKVLANNGFTFKATGKGYVSSITNPDGVTLAEYTNGPRSGWMYTINNIFPDYMASTELKDGDEMVFFYTDDYKETGWDPNGKPGTSSTGGGEAVKPEELKDITVEDGTAKIDLDEEKARLAAENAASSGKNTIEINADEAGDINKAVLNISKKGLEEIAEKAGMGVTLKTPFGNISLGGKNIEALNKTVKESIAVTAEKTENGIIISVTGDGDEIKALQPAVLVSLTNGKFNTAADENGKPVKLSADIDGIMYVFTDKTGGIYLKNYENGFDDVLSTAWYTADVDFVCGHGLMSGTGNNKFSPDINITRGMFAAMLYRLEGEPEVRSENKFGDVSENEYYYKAVVWAAENGIVSGTSETAFSPDDNITREQLAVMLKNYGEKFGIGLSGIDFTDIFDDFDTVSHWAEDGINWAVENKIISGKGENTLAPKDNATRAESAAVLRRFTELVISSNI